MKRFVDSSTEELILWKELKLTSCIEQDNYNSLMGA